MKSTQRDEPGLPWLAIVRLGLVQTAIGALVVLPTSTFNRVMTVEFGMLASLPAGLVAWHYVVQLTRPRWGHGSDVGGARTPWILGGVAVLALGAVLAAISAPLLKASFALGFALAFVAYALIGGGVAAAGTSLLAFLASAVAPQRRPAAAALTWTMMILGIVLTAGVAGAFLEPFSSQRLIWVTAAVGVCATALATVAAWRVERTFKARTPAPSRESSAPSAPFAQTLRDTWNEPFARHFTVFVFLSMLAYYAQELILEPYAGFVFGYTVKESTQLAGLQNGGVLLGMVLIGVIGARAGGHDARGLRVWMVGGCVGSAAALMIIAAAGVFNLETIFKPAVFALGFCNGVFAVSAIGAMMALAGAGRGGREGMRMGVWGAAQAMAFGVGGLLGAVGVDILRALWASDAPAFATVFALEGALFAFSAVMALKIGGATLEGLARTPALPTDFAAEQAATGGRP